MPIGPRDVKRVVTEIVSSLARYENDVEAVDKWLESNGIESETADYVVNQSMKALVAGMEEQIEESGGDEDVLDAKMDLEATVMMAFCIGLEVGRQYPLERKEGGRAEP